ncbi:MAG TPA: glycosyltransferase [Acidobacteriota bacterium]|nr:glycosyltransferase [Acidobacteriota bacterium]
MISVVIPAYREATEIEQSLERLFHPQVSRGIPFEVIVSVAGEDDTLRVVEEFSRRRGLDNLRAVKSPKSRGLQLNRGAGEARYSVLLFMHADVSLPIGALPALAETLDDEGVLGGSFLKRYHQRTPRFWGNIAVSYLRVRLFHVFFGNDCLFVRREVFEELEGFAPIPLMEDVDFSRRLRQLRRRTQGGRLEVINLPVRASARRYLKRGVLRQTWTILRTLTAYKLGRPPQELERRYYGKE